MTDNKEKTGEVKQKTKQRQALEMSIGYLSMLVVISVLLALPGDLACPVSAIAGIAVAALLPLVTWLLLGFYKKKRPMQWFWVLFILFWAAIFLPTPLRSLYAEFFVWITGGR